MYKAVWNLGTEHPYSRRASWRCKDLEDARAQGWSCAYVDYDFDPDEDLDFSESMSMLLEQIIVWSRSQSLATAGWFTGDMWQPGLFKVAHALNLINLRGTRYRFAECHAESGYVNRSYIAMALSEQVMSSLRQDEEKPIESNEMAACIAPPQLLPEILAGDLPDQSPQWYMDNKCIVVMFYYTYVGAFVYGSREQLEMLTTDLGIPLSAGRAPTLDDAAEG